MVRKTSIKTAHQGKNALQDVGADVSFMTITSVHSLQNEIEARWQFTKRSKKKLGKLWNKVVCSEKENQPL